MTIIARKRSYVRLKAYLYSPSQKPNFDDFENERFIQNWNFGFSQMAKIANLTLSIWAKLDFYNVESQNTTIQ